MRRSAVEPRRGHYRTVGERRVRGPTPRRQLPALPMRRVLVTIGWVVAGVLLLTAMAAIPLAKRQWEWPGALAYLAAAVGQIGMPFCLVGASAAERRQNRRHVGVACAPGCLRPPSDMGNQAVLWSAIRGVTPGEHGVAADLRRASLQGTNQGLKGQGSHSDLRERRLRVRQRRF
jgi:hypothetical protein